MLVLYDMSNKFPTARRTEHDIGVCVRSLVGHEHDVRTSHDVAAISRNDRKSLFGYGIFRRHHTDRRLKSNHIPVY